MQDGMSRRELLPWLCGLPLVGGLAAYLTGQQARAGVDGGGCPLDSDLDYADAATAARSGNIVVYFDDVPVRGVTRGSASQGWMEAYSERDGLKRYRGKVRFKVLGRHECERAMKTAVSLK